MVCVRTLRFIICILALSLCAQEIRSQEGTAAGHIDVWLRNEAGDAITKNNNAYDPYSPKKTCGACHNYNIIIQGRHFQQGFPDTQKKEPSPVLPAAIIPDDIKPSPYKGSTAYDWIAACSAFHPGGGPMEQSSSGISLIQEEVASMGKDDPAFQSTLTPDNRSHFRSSGTLEADCLMCHLSAYDAEKRNSQIQARNYRWAATAGAGFGEIQGRIWTPDDKGGIWNFSIRPVVRYNWENDLFNKEGMLSGAAIDQGVSSSACLRCHGDMQAFHTGTLHRKEDSAHVRAGMRCADCHTLATGVPGGRLSHNIGRNASDGTVETTGMKTCTGCHLDGQYSKIRKGMPEKAPSPLIAHADTFYNASFHLRLLACTACHVTSSPARGAYLLDLSTGKPLWYTAESMQAFTERASAAGPASNPWKPWIAVLDLKGTCGERYVPVAMHTAQWFGETGSDGIVRPIGTDTVYKAFEQTKGITSISVFNTAGKSIRRKTAATENDIAGVLKSLKRLGKANPVFVSDKIYAYEKGRIIKTDLPFETTLNLPIWHNVSPISKKQTLGAKGCLDCHDKKSLFFNKLKIVNIGRFLKEDYPEPKKPNAVPQMSEWGYKRVPSHD